MSGTQLPASWCKNIKTGQTLTVSHHGDFRLESKLGKFYLLLVFMFSVVS